VIGEGKNPRWELLPYEVSNKGRVRHEVTKRILKPRTRADGYLDIVLTNDLGRRHCRYIHRLVAQAFKVNPKELPVVNHIDRNRANNHSTNLEWADHRTNSRHCPWCTRLKKEVARLKSELDKATRACYTI
jgi:hypothetical protein